MRISYSSLNDYETCPLKFKYRNIEKLEEPENVERIFGSLVHDSLEYMFSPNPLYPTQDEIIDYFNKNFETKKQKNGELKLDDALRNDGILILKNFYKKNTPWNYNVVDLESRFEVMIDDPLSNEPCVLTGVIDRLDKLDENTYEIIDYKTGKKLPSQDNVDRDLQMSIYNLGLINRWPHLKEKNIKLSLYYVKHGEKLTTSRQPKELEETKNKIINLIREIKNREKKGDFPATPSVLCNWCGFRQICPMWRHLYKKASAPTEEEMQKILAEYFGIKDAENKNKFRLEELKELIHEFMDKEKVDRVFGGEGYITRTIKSTPVYDGQKIREILEPLGKWDDVLEFDDSKLAKLINLLPPDKKEEISKAIIKMKETKILTANQKSASSKNSLIA